MWLLFVHSKKSVEGNILIKLSHSEARLFKTPLFTPLAISCNFKISAYCPSSIINYQNCVDLPEPTGINMPVRLKMVFKSALLIPRSALCDFPWAWLDTFSGTRHP